MSFLNSLYSVPLDCLSITLSFLPLKDALAFASTSSASLSDVLPELVRRRSLMSETHVWFETFDDLDSPKSCSIYEYSSLDVSKHSNFSDIHYIPPVLDRLRCLKSALPQSHSLRDDVCNLVKDLETYHVSKRSIEKLCKRGESVIDTASAILQLQKIMIAHKLHSSILRKAIYIEDHTPTSSNVQSSSSSMELTVTLDKYIGDVLIAFFLMGHSVSNIVEGGPSEEAWMKNIPNYARGNKDISTKKWYQTWIFIHSSVLRAIPLSGGQQLQLGIASHDMLTFMLSSKSLKEYAQLAYILSTNPLDEYDQRNENDDFPSEIDYSFIIHQQPRPFEGVNKEVIFSNLLYEDNGQDFLKPLKITFNDFGPLGPAFRGRDNIRSFEMNPNNDVFLKYFHTKIGTGHSDHKSINRRILDVPRGGNDSLDVLLQVERDLEMDVINMNKLFRLHEEVRKTRPMTVAPPVVSLGF